MRRDRKNQLWRRCALLERRSEQAARREPDVREAGVHVDVVVLVVHVSCDVAFDPHLAAWRRWKDSRYDQEKLPRLDEDCCVGVPARLLHELKKGFINEAFVHVECVDYLNSSSEIVFVGKLKNQFENFDCGLLAVFWKIFEKR